MNLLAGLKIAQSALFQGLHVWFLLGFADFLAKGAKTCTSSLVPALKFVLTAVGTGPTGVALRVAAVNFRLLFGQFTLQTALKTLLSILQTEWNHGLITGRNALSPTIRAGVLRNCTMTANSLAPAALSGDLGQ